MAKAASRCVSILTPACLVLVLATSLVALSPNAASARTWHVPGDAPTIQAGIDLAQPGDDVLVAPGTYYEHDIVMKGGIWVHSEAGPDVTIVDALYLGRVFDCANLPEATTIEGLSMRHGRATGDTVLDGSGGGIRIIRSDATIRSCIILECESTWYCGGGPGGGGGIYSYEDGQGQSRLAVSNCEIISCTTDGIGGGIFSWATAFRIEDSLVTDNEACATGGILASGASIEVLRCSIFRNLAIMGEGGLNLGGGSPTNVEGCLIANNAAGDQASADAIKFFQVVGHVTDCTIANNRGAGYPAVLDLFFSNVAFERVILAFNDGTVAQCPGSQATWRCTDVYRNWSADLCGTDLGGNFAADPMFCDEEDYLLDADSPCLPGNHPDGIDCGQIGARGEGCGPETHGACCFNGLCFVLTESICEDRHGIYQGNGTTCDPNPCRPTPTRPTTWGRIKSSFH